MISSRPPSAGDDSAARPPEADLELAENLRIAVGAFVRTMRAEADLLPRAVAEVLRHLDRNGAQTIRELADARAVRHQGMSRAIIGLEEDGFVSRSRNTADARGWIITLTDSGRAALRHDRDARRSALAARIVSELDGSERELLTRVPELLRKLTHHDDRS